MDPTQIKLRHALLPSTSGRRQILRSASHKDVVRAVVYFVEYFGAFPAGVVHRAGSSTIVYDPAVVRDRNGYTVYNCYFYDRAKRGNAGTTPRHFTDAVDAVEYYLRSEPIGGHPRNYRFFPYCEVICRAPGG